MKYTMLKERIFDIICLAASYVILFLLPQKVDFVFYLIFGASAFLFCIGFFRLGLSFDAPADSKGELFAGVFSAVFRAAAVFLVIFGIAFAVWKHLSIPSAAIAVMFLIESICLWRMGGGSHSFNTLTSEIQTVPGLRVPVAQLQQAFAGVETQLGYPWIGKVKRMKRDSIIYGPSEDGFCVYGYYLFGRFYVSGSTNPLFPDPENAQGHAVAEVPGKNGILLAKEDLPEAYAKMFAGYARSGNALWIPDLTD